MPSNEFKHSSVGITMTQAEFEAIGLHVFNSQATGDILYASSSTQLSRLGVGSNNDVLHLASGIPAWSATLAGITLTAPTLNGTVTLGSTPIFDAGSGSAQINTTGGGDGLVIQSTQDGGTGTRITTDCVSASAADGDVVFDSIMKGRNDNATPETISYCRVMYLIEDASDGTEAGKVEWRNRITGADNTVMTLSSLGALAVDINSSVTYGDDDHPVSVFDAYDDALILKQGIQQRGMDRLCEVGVFSKKDSGSGYMMNIQAFNYLLAGGIYQNRARIDDLVDALVDEFPQVAKRLAERNLLVLPLGG